MSRWSPSLVNDGEGWVGGLSNMVALSTQGPHPLHLVSIFSDGEDVVADYATTSGGSTFTRTASYIGGLGIDSKYVKLDGTGSPTYYVPDALGSVGVVIDAAGTVQDARLTNAWGEQLRAPQTPDRYGYTQREAMPEIAILGGTAAMHYRARTYFPELGRFGQRDPKEREDRGYSYVKNRPTLLVDPSGLWATQIHNNLLEGAFLFVSEPASGHFPAYALDAWPST